MRLEVGKRYYRRDGGIEGPLFANDSADYPFTNLEGTATWACDGHFQVGKSCHLDLVREIRVYGLFDEIPLSHYQRGVERVFDQYRI